MTLAPVPLSEHVAQDYMTTGLSLKGHPVAFFREHLKGLGVMSNAEHRSESLAQNQMVTVAGIVLTRQMPGAKGVGMAVYWHNRIGLPPRDDTRPDYLEATLDRLADLFPPA